MTYKKGIDVSEHNGVIDWDQVKASGIEFAMLRGGYGTTEDKKFLRNAMECSRVGMPFGVYWFSYAMTPERAIQEADFCLETIRPYKITYPVAYDYEYDSVAYAKKHGVTMYKDTVSKIAAAFLQTVRNGGYRAMNYANPDFLRSYFNDKTVTDAFPLWLSQWPKAVNLDSPPRSCEIWQYSSTGKVPGISGDVDLDVCYAAFDSPETNREVVQKRAGLAGETMEYLAKYRYSEELFRKLAAAMRR